MMPIRLFIGYWVLWNFYWSVPYSFLWRRFSEKKKTGAVNLTAIVMFFVFQVIVPLVLFERLFEIKDFSPFSMAWTFLVLCMPAFICNTIVPKLSAIKFGVAGLYSVTVLIVIFMWLYLWIAYLDAIITSRTLKIWILTCWWAAIPLISCLFIRLFLKAEEK